MANYKIQNSTTGATITITEEEIEHTTPDVTARVADALGITTDDAGTYITILWLSDPEEEKIVLEWMPDKYIAGAFQNKITAIREA